VGVFVYLTVNRKKLRYILFSSKLTKTNKIVFLPPAKRMQSMFFRERKSTYQQLLKKCIKYMFLNFRVKKIKVKEKRHKCEHCDKMFSMLNRFNHHMKEHTGQKPLRLFSFNLCKDLNLEIHFIGNYSNLLEFIFATY